ncbi:MAG: HpcH/HpaI aldolase family protein [Burkholderiaceae bacterium]
MQNNSIKASCLAGETVAGAMVFEFFSPGIAKILSDTGCQFVIYDMEHTGLGLETLKTLFATCRGVPIEPMVRVPRGDYAFLARALDIGATGVMIPMVESAEHATQIASACRYPPTGRRGAAFGFAHDDYESGSVLAKIETANERTMVIAQIETERGLENLEAIAAVPGIDVLWLGHFDLTNFLGIPGDFDHPRFDAAMREIAAVARKHGKAAGFMATDHAWVERARQSGYNMIAIGSDISLLSAGASQLIEQVNS